MTLHTALGLIVFCGRLQDGGSKPTANLLVGSLMTRCAALGALLVGQDFGMVLRKWTGHEPFVARVCTKGHQQQTEREHRHGCSNPATAAS
jgi:hypothetical protein